MLIEHYLNCWELLLGQSAAKPEREGSTTRSKDRTLKRVEMGRIPLGLRYSLICMVTCSSPIRTDKKVANLIEHSVMEELFVAPLHYGFVFFGWLALAICGVLLQIFASFGNLIGKQVIEAVDAGMIAK